MQWNVLVISVGQPGFELSRLSTAAGGRRAQGVSTRTGLGQARFEPKARRVMSPWSPNTLQYRATCLSTIIQRVKLFLQLPSVEKRCGIKEVGVPLACHGKTTISFHRFCRTVSSCSMRKRAPTIIHGMHPAR